MKWRKFPLLALLLLGLGGWNVHGYVAPFSQRTVIDASLFDQSEYAWINLFQAGQGTITPYGSAWASGTPYWNSAVLDANGYPCTSVVNSACPYAGPANPANGRAWGAAFWPPSATNYSGNKCLQGFGVGTATFPTLGTGTWTQVTGSGTTCAAFSTGATNNCSSANATLSGTTLTTTDATWAGWCLVLTRTGANTQASNFTNIKWTADDPNSVGYYIKGLMIYEQSDGPDLVAGNVFRSAYKQPIVDLDPCCIRFMEWMVAGTGGADMRFEQRATPTNELGMVGDSLVVPFVPYTGATASGLRDQYALASASGMPVAMQHGEHAYFRADTTSIQEVTYNNPITALSIPMAGTVEITVTTTGFQTGDSITFYSMGAGNTLLNYFWATNVTVVDGTHIEFAFSNTAGLSACAASCGNFAPLYTLNVGGRGIYPVISAQAIEPFGAYYVLNAGTYYHFCFNKNVSGQQDGAGNWIYGAWVYCGVQNHSVPLEMIAKLIAELNAMKPAHLITAWLNMPYAGLICSVYYSDPDCTSNSDYPVNAVNTVLSNCAGCEVFVEDTNETWNSGYPQYFWYVFMGGLPSSGANAANTGCGQSTSDPNSYSTLHSELVMNDIKTGVLGSVKYILGGQEVGGSGGNYNGHRITGSGLATTCKPQFPSGTPASNPPIHYYDAFAVAPYFYVPSGYVSGNYATDAAQWVSDVLTYGYTSSQAQADLQTYVNEVVSGAESGNGHTVSAAETNQTAEAALLATYGRYLVNYEGGFQFPSSPDPTIAITAASCAADVVSITATGNTYTNGQTIQDYDMVPNGYNGLFSVVGTGNTFTYNVSACPGTATSFGYATTLSNAYQNAARASAAWGTAQLNFNKYMAASANQAMPSIFSWCCAIQWTYAWPDMYSYTGTSPSPSPAPITALSCAGGLVTVTVSNNYSSGQSILVYDMLPVGYNGLQTLASASGAGFTFNVASCPSVETQLGYATTEGAGLPPMWTTLSSYNQGQVP